MSDLNRVNRSAQTAAQKAGRATYRHQVIDYWPACSTCGTPIRRQVDVKRLGMWRGCACPDVAWTNMGIGYTWTRFALNADGEVDVAALITPAAPSPASGGEAP